MGNTQQIQKARDRAESDRRSDRHHQRTLTEDECPVQVKIAKNSTEHSAGDISVQYENTTEFPVVVKWSGGATAKNVSISGSWDGWKRRLPLVKSQDDFTTIINLPEGKHEFKFFVDGAWVCDNHLPKTDNQMGTQNNVVLIDRADFEVFDALDRDLASSQGGPSVASGQPGSSSTTDREVEKGKMFTQEIPDRHEFERAHHPPVLPPHLLQVILNKDTPVSCDPNVLPEPNHVMLNHLYALSIKDGVMVLSATHRYRKKYVTTLLYKPI